MRGLIHVRNLLIHTLLFCHFLENLKFWFWNILKYIRTMFSGNTCLFSKTTDSELLKYGSLSWKLQKTKVTNLPFFKQIHAENKIAICQCIPFFMRYVSELFSNVGQFAFFYASNKPKIFQFLSSLSIKLYVQYVDNVWQSHCISARLGFDQSSSIAMVNIYPSTV